MDSNNQESKNLSLGQVSYMDNVSQIFDMIRTLDNDQSWKILVFLYISQTTTTTTTATATASTKTTYHQLLSR